MMTLTKTILDLLITKHNDQICVPECKTGSQWIKNNIQSIDLWVMNKSWTKNWTIAYEIKVSRQDFLRDEKWRGYLPYCNYFYFVAPQGIIQPEELGSDVGLLIGSKNLKKLYTKKKAPYRDVRIPEEIWRYILMWRANIIKERTAEINNTEYWQNWLKEKDEKKRLGHNVSKKIRELATERIENVKIENHRLEAENKGLAHVKEFLIKNGVNEQLIKSGNDWRIERDFKKLLAEVKTGLPEGTMNYLITTINNLQHMERVFKRKIDKNQADLF